MVISRRLLLVAGAASPASAYGQCVIEEARTNILFPSVPSTTDNWITQGAVTFGSAGGSVTLPDGTSSTTSLLAATSTAVDNRDILRNPGPAATGNTTYTVSAFVKSSAGSNAYIQVNGDGAPVGYYNLTAGTAVVGQDLGPGATNKSVAITPLANGWYRISMTFTSGPATTSLLVFIGTCSVVSTSGDNRSTAGVVGHGIYIWGVQAEPGAFASSYIPATNAPVGRAPRCGR